MYIYECKNCGNKFEEDEVDFAVSKSYATSKVIKPKGYKIQDETLCPHCLARGTLQIKGAD